MTRAQNRQLIAIRKLVANWFYGIGRAIYPFSKYEPDEVETFCWEMNASFVGTEKQADDWFAKLTDLACPDDGTALHDCSFVVGGMVRQPWEEDDDDTSKLGAAQDAIDRIGEIDV